MQFVLAFVVLAFIVAITTLGLTGRLKVGSCCAVADPSRDLRMRGAFEDGTAATFSNDTSERNECTIEANAVLVVTSGPGADDPSQHESLRRGVQDSPQAWTSVQEDLEAIRPRQRSYGSSTEDPRSR